MDSTLSEEWRPVNGEFSGARYEVSNFGRFRRADTKRILKLRNHNKGYLYAAFYVSGAKHEVGVHRLVLSAFHAQPFGVGHQCECNHKDLNRSNNHISNLEWVTPRENKLHAALNGGGVLYANGHRKLSPEQVAIIRRSRDTQDDLAARFVVSRRTIERIQKRERYVDVA